MQVPTDSTEPSVASVTQQTQELAVSTAAQAAAPPAPARATPVPAPAPAPAAPASPPPAPQVPWATTNERKCLIIPRADQPNLIHSWPFPQVWSWLITLLVASRTSDLRTVPQGTIFEIIVAVCLSFIYEGNAKVELVGASSTPGQGDDGTDIEIEQQGDSNLANEIIDCKNYSWDEINQRGTKGTRPNVRSVIGALMTSDLTTGKGNAKGIGTLLVTSSFTDGALASMEKFNEINELTGYRMRCWTFENEFKQLLTRAFNRIRSERQRNDAARELLREILKQLLSPGSSNTSNLVISPQRGLIIYE